MASTLLGQSDCKSNKKKRTSESKTLIGIIRRITATAICCASVSESLIVSYRTGRYLRLPIKDVDFFLLFPVEQADFFTFLVNRLISSLFY